MLKYSNQTAGRLCEKAGLVIMRDISKELIQNTIEVWSRKAGYKLSEDEASEIIQNTTGFIESLDKIAIRITEVTSGELIDEGNFISIGKIDNLIPDEKGLYCIRLTSNSILPERYQLELNNRKSKLIYIGKAEKKSLRERFLNEELRAKGHGTFFRSVGAMLGFNPLIGSLKNRRNKNNYRFSKNDEFRIIDWINNNLEASWMKFENLFIIEKYLIKMHKPLLNIKSNPIPFRVLVKDRNRCKVLARG